MMQTKVKRKMVNVQPISNDAKNRFSLMDYLHGCYVDSEDDQHLFLSSINKKYLFCVNKQDDANWRIVK